MSAKRGTTLNERFLWADGTSQVDPANLPSLLLKGAKPEQLCVAELTPDITLFNKHSDGKIAVGHVLASNSFPPEWSVPDEYKYLNLDKHLIELADRVKQDELYEQRLARLAEEIDLFIRLGYSDLLRALIYVLDVLKRERIVWGVGRGSSCSSYLLHLLGLHEVDCVKYEIPLSDFIRDE